MDDYKRKKYLQFLSSNSERFKNKEFLNKVDLEYFFICLIELLEIPFPPSELRSYFLHPNIISIFFEKILGSKYLTRDDRFAVQQSFITLEKKVGRSKSNFSINFRVLDPSGRYPNMELSRGGNKYTISNQYPLLITKNRNKKDISVDSSIINWLTRNELKFVTSIMCAPQYGMLHFYFTSQNTLTIDSDCFKNIPPELHIYFLKELFDAERRFKPIGARYWSGRKLLPDVNEYEYEDYEEHITTYRQLFDNFTIQDDLLLRTCNYFVKAIMHWDNLIYAEDAIINNFMCLEGCLHLIQKKYGDFKPQLNRELLKKVFKENITHGERIYEVIEDGYELRISLIHAEPRWGSKWDPFVMMDDFYDYYKINRMLLNFILIDRTYDIW